jgi:ribA/ribD-fused uncharacterized protein
MSDPIRFFGRRAYAEWFFLSNFYYAKMIIDGVKYKTVEHFYQSMKFWKGTTIVIQDTLVPREIDLRSYIAEQPTPREAADLGRSSNFTHLMIDNWEEDVCFAVMMKGVYHKFKQNPNLLEKLLGTDNRIIIEASPFDYRWGEGRDGTGENYLGRTIMGVRDRLRKEMKI